MFFADIIGQQAAKKQLIKSVKDGRISHAQLFLGPKGAGSLPLAIAYSRYISCEHRGEEDSCGQCPSCIKYNKLIHPDLHFVFPMVGSKDTKDKSENDHQWRAALLNNPYITLYEWFETLNAENKQATIGVSESAAILRKLSLTTYETEYKIVIVWYVEKMNLAAANKLLKILEEPPDKTLFLLICESEDQLLSTIVSRTQRIKLNKIKEDELVQALMHRNGLSEEAAKSIANIADGDYSEALQLVNEDENMEQNLVNFQRFMRASLKFDAEAIVEWIEDQSKTGRERQKNFLKYALHIVRECLVVNNSVDKIVKLTERENEFVVKFSPFIHSANIGFFVDEINEAYRHLERNASPKILFMDLAFKFNELLNLPKTN